MIKVLCIVKIIKMVRIYLTKARKISLKLSTKQCNPGLEGEGRVSISWFYKGLNLLSLVLSAFKPLIRI